MAHGHGLIPELSFYALLFDSDLGLCQLCLLADGGPESG